MTSATTPRVPLSVCQPPRARHAGIRAVAWAGAYWFLPPGRGLAPAPGQEQGGVPLAGAVLPRRLVARGGAGHRRAWHQQLPARAVCWEGQAMARGASWHADASRYHNRKDRGTLRAIVVGEVGQQPWRGVRSFHPLGVRRRRWRRFTVNTPQKNARPPPIAISPDGPPPGGLAASYVRVAPSGRQGHAGACGAGRGHPSAVP